MKHPKNKSDQGLYKGVTTAYLILILHIVLIAAVGMLVVFFGGMIRYMLWIFLGVVLIIIVSGYIFYRRLKRQGQQLNDTLNSPTFSGRSVEINFMGGLASFRMGGSNQQPALEIDRIDPPRQLEDPETMRIRRISDVAKLYEDEIISEEEFNALKSRIIDT